MYIYKADRPPIEVQMPPIQVHYMSSLDRSSTMHIYTGGRCLAYQYITFVFLIDLAQYIYIYIGSRCYFQMKCTNCDILIIILLHCLFQNKTAVCYIQRIKKSTEDLKYYMLSSKDTNSEKKIAHLWFNRYIYTEMETSGMVNL